MAALEAQIKEGTDHGRQPGEEAPIQGGAVRWEQAVPVMQAGGGKGRLFIRPGEMGETAGGEGESA